MNKLYDGKFDGTADIESYLDDTPRDRTWWHRPAWVSAVAMAYAAGWVSAVWLIQS